MAPQGSSLPAKRRFTSNVAVKGHLIEVHNKLEFNTKYSKFYTENK